MNFEISKHERTPVPNLFATFTLVRNPNDLLSCIVSYPLWSLCCSTSPSLHWRPRPLSKVSPSQISSSECPKFPILSKWCLARKKRKENKGTEKSRWTCLLRGLTSPLVLRSSRLTIGFLSGITSGSPTLFSNRFHSLFPKVCW